MNESIRRLTYTIIIFFNIILICTAKEEGKLKLPDDITFFNSLNLDYPGFDKVKIAVNNNNYTLAKSELLKYYQNRPEYSEGTRYGRSYFPLMISDANKQEADSITDEHKFSDHGNPPYIFMGKKIDWITKALDPNPTTMMRHWLNRHWWMIRSLGPVYAVTRDEKYAEEWISEIVNWTCDVPKIGWGNSLDAGIRSQNWVTSYQYFVNKYHSSSVDPERHLIFLESIQLHADYLKTVETQTNWGVFQAQGLLTIAVMFPEFKASDEWLNIAASKMERHLKTDFRNDGTYVENAPAYGLEVLNLYLKMHKLEQINNLTLFKPDFYNILNKAVEYFMFFDKPDKRCPSFGDSGDNDGNSVLIEAAKILDREDMKYVSSSGLNGKMPKEISKFYPDGEYAIMRSGWDTSSTLDQQLFLAFENGPYGGWHDHFDWLNFEAYAYGKDLIIDSKKGNYDDVNLAYKCRRSSAHNTVTVDNKDQVLFSWLPTGNGKYGSWANSSLPDHGVKSWATNSGYDYINAWITSSNFGNITHSRKIFFVRNEYWIISDILTGGSDPHTYEQYFQLPRQSLGNTKIDPTSKAVCSTFNNLIIVPADPEELTANIVDGFRGDVTAPNAPTIRYEKTSSAAASFDVLIYPYPSDIPAVSLVRTVTKRGTANLLPSIASGLKIKIRNSTDFYFISHDSPVSTDYGKFKFDGEAGYVRKNADQIINIQLKDCTKLEEGNKLLVDTYGIKANVGAVSGKVEITGPVSKFKVWAPGALTVILNGQGAAFKQMGSYVISLLN